MCSKFHSRNTAFAFKFSLILNFINVYQISFDTTLGTGNMWSQARCGVTTKTKVLHRVRLFYHARGFETSAFDVIQGESFEASSLLRQFVRRYGAGCTRALLLKLRAVPVGAVLASRKITS